MCADVQAGPPIQVLPSWTAADFAAISMLAILLSKAAARAVAGWWVCVLYSWCSHHKLVQLTKADGGYLQASSSQLLLVDLAGLSADRPIAACCPGLYCCSGLVAGMLQLVWTASAPMALKDNP
jgi:hypothetical protein